ncbi:MAG: 4Fe-4S dicluster domain-containing protein [Deltaproteobacteria bacterium]|nr:4Fe-4S dicluster domain-containing protein [Deltaproteobacteria bacterium]
MVDRVIAIDYDKCTGCRICEIACSIKNSEEVNPVKSRIRVVRIESDGNAHSFPVLCMKCVEAFCMTVCPVGAISNDLKTGVPVINPDKCIGCSSCVYACPFGAVSVDRILGHAFKCHLCDGEPTCVQFCPRDAIQYLDSAEVGIRLRRSSLENFIACAGNE